MADDPNQLVLTVREHDLPPLWDGCPLAWGTWTQPPHPFVCPPPRDPRVCERCGSTNPPLIAHGVRTVPFGDNVVRIHQARLQPREQRHRLIAQRCPDCRADVVWDTATNEWWDLDDTDYLDAGSYAVDTPL